MTEADIKTIDAVVGWITGLAGAFLLPIALLVLILYLLLSKGAGDRVARLLQPFSSFKFLGQEFVLTNPGKVTASAENAFRAYRSDTKAKYDALVAKHRIDTLHQRLVRDVLSVQGGNGPEYPDGFRSTIHVRDILFAESFYQLLPYFPKGGGEGRSWSIRYGIVGKTWRHEQSTWEGNLLMSQADLIESWGMTKQEAADAKKTRPSLVAVVLRDDTNTAVGILFADANAIDAFGDSITGEHLAKRLETAAHDIGLTRALASLVGELPPEPLIPMLGKKKPS